MEPERKIEKLLRAYAKKRRAKADDSFKLHPATRHLLQGEVARRKPVADDNETSLSLWELFRTNWAVLAGFVLVIFFCASFLMPALNKAKHTAKSFQTMSSLKEIGMAAQIVAADNNDRLPATLDGLTNAIGSSVTLTDAVSGQRFVYVASNAVLDDLPTNAVLAYSPGDQKQHIVLFADGSVRRVRQVEFSALTNKIPSTLMLAASTSSYAQKKLPEANSPATSAAASPAGAVEPADSISSVPGVPGGIGGAKAPHPFLYFQTKLAADADQPESGSPEFSRETLHQATSPPVLASFALRPDGSHLSIVDRDGSIYQGTWKQVNTAGIPQMDFKTSRESSSTLQAYAFQSAGTNRTLNQSVVFIGSLFATFNTNSNAMFYLGAGQTERSQTEHTNIISTEAISPLGITGTVTLAHTNQIKVIALPTTR